MLKHVTTAGRSFTHPLFHKGIKPLGKDEAPALVARLRAGSIEARQRAVEGITRLALLIVGRYIAVYPKIAYYCDDMVSAAMDGTVEGVQHFGTECKHDNLVGYVRMFIHRKISEAILDSHTVRVPARSVSRHLKNDNKIIFPHRVPLSDDCQKISANKPISDLEVEEILAKTVQNEDEQTILTARQEGRNDQEIAEMMGSSKTTVFLIRREMENRFLELMYGNK